MKDYKSDAEPSEVELRSKRPVFRHTHYTPVLRLEPSQRIDAPEELKRIRETDTPSETPPRNENREDDGVK